MSLSIFSFIASYFSISTPPHLIVLSHSVGVLLIKLNKVTRTGTFMFPNRWDIVLPMVILKHMFATTFVAYSDIQGYSPWSPVLFPDLSIRVSVIKVFHHIFLRCHDLLLHENRNNKHYGSLKEGDIL